MRFVLALVASALLAAAQTDPAGPTGSASAPAAASSNSIVIISPTGNLAYKSGDPVVITWNINTGADQTWLDTQVTFEIADASKGANKVTPINKMLNGTSSISDLQLSTVVPDGIPAGGSYCVRADVRGPSGFVYFFSPNFPINQALSASSGGAAVMTTGASAAAGANAAVTMSPSVAPVVPTTASPAAATTSKSSNAERLAVCLVGALAVFAL
ncbi:hypothetical protein BC830DRAFT_1119766 [Chytriomyces sp. MP71]|nr:hypothetical protein BC830DRAFT_1119766 [Chytriomyces sp. MP71]